MYEESTADEQQKPETLTEKLRRQGAEIKRAQQEESQQQNKHNDDDDGYDLTEERWFKHLQNQVKNPVDRAYEQNLRIQQFRDNSPRPDVIARQDALGLSYWASYG